MLTTLSIIWNSFKMAIQELRVNKLRTFLSLFGITIGIFCIIGVLATVNSLEKKVQDDVNSLGSNTVYVAKFSFNEDDDGSGGRRPQWKIDKRPQVTIQELNAIKAKSFYTDQASFMVITGTSLEYNNNILSGVSIYSISEEFLQVQSLEVAQGRYISQSEFKNGSSVIVLGHENAVNLFGSPEKAVGKQIKMQNRNVIVVGVLKKYGTSFGGFQYDNCLLVGYEQFTKIYNINNRFLTAFILVKAKPNIPVAALIDELRGIMRSHRKISPTQEDNFALNDVNTFSNAIGGFFKSVNLGGWAIAGLSLIVGAFGVANIMFVSVRERTSQIGLKKAIGAKRSTILTEFLLESAFLCIIGGLIGLLLVYLLTLALNAVMPFPIFISKGIITLAFSICIILGILSGIIPASIAAKMDPVVAIRTK